MLIYAFILTLFVPLGDAALKVDVFYLFPYVFLRYFYSHEVLFLELLF